MAEANSVMCRARARKDSLAPQLEFRRSLALKLMTNKLTNDGTTVSILTGQKRCTRGQVDLGHELLTCPNFTGSWKMETNSRSKISTQYAKIKCAGCKPRLRTYCKCNKKVSLCTECYGDHIADANNIN